MFKKSALFFAVSMAIVIFTVPSARASQFNLTLQQYGEFYYEQGVFGPPDYGSKSGDMKAGSGTMNGGALFSDYFVLDLTSIAADQIITSVSFQTSNLAFVVESGAFYPASYWLAETSAATSDLENPAGSDTAALYGDLSTPGTSLGTSPDYTYSGRSGDPTSLSVPGNSAFVELLNENRGRVLAIAGNLYGAGGGVSIVSSSPSFTVTTAAIPEPSAPALLFGGALAAGLYLRGRMAAQR